MAISYPLSIPTTIGIEQISLRAVNAVARTESPFSFYEQVVQHAGQKWEASVSIPALRSDVMEEWVAFLVSLKGQYGTFTMGDPNLATPRGTAADTPGTPLVAGASQTGSELAIDGLPLSETGYLLPGDYIQLGTGTTSRLYKVLTQVDSDGAGAATLDIWPDIITAPSDNATVVVSNTVGLWRLKNNVGEWTINNSNAYGLSFEAVSVVP